MGYSLLDSSEESLQRGGGSQYICDFGEGSSCNKAHILAEVCC